MMGNGKMIKKVGKVFTIMPMVASIMDNGKIINSMEKEFNTK
jgi:hypothetical protein